jgi:serine/threonine protein phosphatase 1
MITPKRILAVGDIHGELGKLNLLLDWISPSADDIFVFLGDYIDRGHDSRGVIERLMGFNRQFPQSIFLRGNHEQMLLDAFVERSEGSINSTSNTGLRLYSSQLDMWLRNGGKATLESYGLENIENFPLNHIDFIKSTLLWWEFAEFIFVHAGLEEGVPLENQDPFMLLMGRNLPPGRDGKIHVVGHTPTDDGEPCFEPGRYSLDTGVAYGRSLTVCDVLTKTVWQM